MIPAAASATDVGTHLLLSIFSTGDKPLNVAIVAGHFALIPERPEGRLLPAVWEDIPDPDLAQRVKEHPQTGAFPLETFTAGATLASLICRSSDQPLGQAKLVLLVNDWMYVPRASDGERNLAREAFYRQSSLYPEGKIPKSFARIMTRHSLYSYDILPFHTLDGNLNHPLFWSEMALRSQYANHPGKTMTENGCTQEATALVRQLTKRGFTTIVNFVPSACERAWNKGVDMALDECASGVQIVNVYPSGVQALLYPGKKTGFWKDGRISKHTS